MRRPLLFVYALPLLTLAGCRPPSTVHTGIGGAGPDSIWFTPEWEAERWQRRHDYYTTAPLPKYPQWQGGTAAEREAYEREYDRVYQQSHEILKYRIENE